MPKIARDWDALEKSIEEHGYEMAAKINGYISVESMSVSLRAHKRNVKRWKTAPETERLTSTPNVQINESGDKTIPDDIRRQLLDTEMINVDQLFIDPIYQREEKTAKINKMVREWSWYGCRTLAVNLRSDGKANTYAVIDGQQRLAAIRIMGYKEAPCSIYMDLTRDQEAQLFEILNDNTKPGFNDTFKSRLSRNEHIASAIRAAVESCGYHLDPERKKHSSQGYGGSHYYIQSMAELERIQKVGGAMLIIETLKFLKSAWEGEPIGNQQMVLAGIATFLHTYKSGWNKTEMIAKLKKAGVNRLVQNALAYSAARGKSTGGNSRGIAFCEAMVMMYNYNRQEGNRIKSKFN